MAVFEMSKYSPYRSVQEYQNLRPEYHFEGRSAEAWVAGSITCCLEQVEGGTLAECGCGPGPLWELLPPEVEVLAVEPNRELWPQACPPQVTYVQEDGFAFLREHPGKLDVIAWMWALNYPLLAHFEHYDPIAKDVRLEDWVAGHHRCLDAMVDLLARRKEASWVVLFFDGEAEEQAFVTQVWKEVAPFPFHDRSHTRKVLEMAFQYFSFKTGARLERLHLEGLAEYGDLDQAVERMMNFHLRGNFLDQAHTRQRVRNFLSRFETGGQVRCPAGAYLYRLQPPC